MARQGGAVGPGRRRRIDWCLGRLVAKNHSINGVGTLGHLNVELGIRVARLAIMVATNEQDVQVGESPAPMAQLFDDIPGFGISIMIKVAQDDESAAVVSVQDVSQPHQIRTQPSPGYRQPRRLKGGFLSKVGICNQYGAVIRQYESSIGIDLEVQAIPG